MVHGTPRRCPLSCGGSRRCAFRSREGVPGRASSPCLTASLLRGPICPSNGVAGTTHGFGVGTIFPGFLKSPIPLPESRGSRKNGEMESPPGSCPSPGA
jgi:hypothetical protein